jgi:hypothetical protein
VALFRRLFRGRDDVHALRWQSNRSGRSGHAPACANEWRPGICEKPRISCRDCNHRELLPLSDAAIYGHLAGDHTIGLYPLLENDHCHLLAADFDEQDWRDDARAFLRSCRELAVPAREARQLGAALMSHTFNATRQLQLSSYDRLFSQPGHPAKRLVRQSDRPEAAVGGGAAWNPCRPCCRSWDQLGAGVHGQTRHRRDAVAGAQGRGESLGAYLRAGDCRRMPPHRGGGL